MLLVAARIALGVAFQTAGLAAPFLVQDWGIDYAAAGGLVGLFWIPGLFLVLGAGPLARRFGEGRMVAAGLLMLAAGVAVSAASAGEWLFGAGRLLTGAGAALLMALLMKMVADWFTGRWLFLGMACFIVGWPIGIAGTQFALAPMAEASWRGALLAGAGFVALVGLAFAAFYRAPPGAVATSAARERMTGREAWLVLVAGLGWTIYNGAYLVLVTFGPVLLAERDAVGGAEAARAASLLSWVFALCIPLGGLLSARMAKPAWLSGGALAASALAAAAVPLSGAAAAAPLMVAIGVLSAFATPYLSTQPVQALRPASRANGLGLYYFLFYLGCTALPPVAGWLKDHHGPEAPMWFAVGLLATTVLLMAVFALGLARLRRGA
ncbi:MFS transporter [Falsiroseomonas sp. HW251]|uniref:MFS transporter n=1 Tax=Falsiroseomonas sp. HW251 TaxID=3390998 RepID=UPI003D313449